MAGLWGWEVVSERGGGGGSRWQSVRSLVALLEVFVTDFPLLSLVLWCFFPPRFRIILGSGTSVSVWRNVRLIYLLFRRGCPSGSGQQLAFPATCVDSWCQNFATGL